MMATTVHLCQACGLRTLRLWTITTASELKQYVCFPCKVKDRADRAAAIKEHEKKVRYYQKWKHMYETDVEFRWCADEARIRYQNRDYVKAKKAARDYYREHNWKKALHRAVDRILLNDVDLGLVREDDIVLPPGDNDME